MNNRDLMNTFDNSQREFMERSSMVSAKTLRSVSPINGRSSIIPQRSIVLKPKSNFKTAKPPGKFDHLPIHERLYL